MLSKKIGRLLLFPLWDTHQFQTDLAPMDPFKEPNFAGDSLHIFDPACTIFPSKEAGKGQGRQFTVTGTDLATRFEDQFSGWDFAGPIALAKQAVNATLIRIPLFHSPRHRFAQVNHFSLPQALFSPKLSHPLLSQGIVSGSAKQRN